MAHLKDLIVSGVTRFIGKVYGTITNAIKDDKDQTISSTYIKDISGGGVNSLTITKGDGTSSNVKMNVTSDNATNADTLDGLHSTSFVNYKYSITDTEMLNNANYTGAPYEGCVSDGSVMGLASHWWHIKYFRHANSDGYGCQVAFPLDRSTSLPQYRISIGPTWQPWKVIGDGGNADTLDGCHASDFMPINGEVRKYGIIRMNGSDGIRVRHIDGNDTEADGSLYLNYNSPNAPIYMNGGNTAIHSGNIGSQSVNYATNAGNATNSDTVGGVSVGDILYTRSALDAVDCNTWGTFICGYTSTALNVPFGGWQTVMSYHCHHFNVQLDVETTSGNLAIRSKWGNTPFSDVSWVRCYGENYKPHTEGSFTAPSSGDSITISLGYQPSCAFVWIGIAGNRQVWAAQTITATGFTFTNTSLSSGGSLIIGAQVAYYIAFR